MSELLKKYHEVIAAMPPRSDRSDPAQELKLWENRERRLECFYAPFEHVNESARIVLIGITPGRTQMNRALAAASRAIRHGTDLEQAILEVKREGSFSGNMRSNIVNTLNKLGYPAKLGISCSSQLWGESNHLVNFCSLLKFPVFIGGKDYNGNPAPMKIPELRAMLVNDFARDLKDIPKDAELVPLGDFVANVVAELDAMKLIPQKIMRFEGKIVAPPHPSGANAESIALLGTETYPEKQPYLEKMYQQYQEKRGWEMREGGKPQTEEKYKAVRSSRWESMLFVRRAYGITS